MTSKSWVKHASVWILDIGKMGTHWDCDIYLYIYIIPLQQGWLQVGSLIFHQWICTWNKQPAHHHRGLVASACEPSKKVVTKIEEMRGSSGTRRQVRVGLDNPQMKSIIKLLLLHLIRGWPSSNLQGIYHIKIYIHTWCKDPFEVKIEACPFKVEGLLTMAQTFQSFR